MSPSSCCLLSGSVDPWAVISTFQTRCAMTGLTDDENRLERLAEIGEEGFLLIAWDGCDWLARLPDGLNTEALLASLAPKFGVLTMGGGRSLNEVVQEVRGAVEPAFAVVPFGALK
jgi:hypothetical protein